MEYLNDKEKAELERFIENPTLMQALKKVMLEGIYYHGKLEAGEDPDPLRNFILGTVTKQGSEFLPDADIGSKVRAIHMAISLLEEAYKKLETLKKVESPIKVKNNPAK